MDSFLAGAIQVMILGCASCLGISHAEAAGPASVKVKCGDILLRIDGPKIWTISRIEYKGTLLGIEDSAYGTVCGFPGIGWLGTGHFLDRPDGKEQVKTLEFFLDGKKLAESNSLTSLTGTDFKLHKQSGIFDINLDSTVELKNDRIYETAAISSEKDVPLTMMYNLMHAWTPSASSVLAHGRSGKELSADFDERGRKEYTLENLEWAAVYDANSSKGAVSYLAANPKTGGADLLIVNAPKIYRKYYLKSFAGQTVPAGFNGTYKMVTAFFTASKESWQSTARNCAGDLKKAAN